MHSNYVIIFVFPRQQWLCERASMLCDTHIACLVEILLLSCPRNTKNSETVGTEIVLRLTILLGDWG
jgi:hypothetical protein